MTQAAQVRQGRALGLLGVAQQAARGADRQSQLFAAEAFEVLSAELLAEAFECGVAVEIPRRTTAHAASLFDRQALRPVVGNQQFSRAQALELGEQVLPAAKLLHAEAAAGDVEYRQAKQSLVAQHRCQQVVPALIEQGFIAHRTRRDDAHDLALHRPLAGRRIADLLADHHRFAELDQAGQVALGRMKGYAGHRDRLAGRLPARRQGDIQELGGFLRVLVEQLVEVTHAVEHQLIGMLALELPVLLHHGGVLGEVRNFFIHQRFMAVRQK